jgi:hypothetical protein
MPNGWAHPGTAPQRNNAVIDGRIFVFRLCNKPLFGFPEISTVTCDGSWPVPSLFHRQANSLSDLYLYIDWVRLDLYLQTDAVDM